MRPGTRRCRGRGSGRGSGRRGERPRSGRPGSRRYRGRQGGHRCREPSGSRRNRGTRRGRNLSRVTRGKRRNRERLGRHPSPGRPETHLSVGRGARRTRSREPLKNPPGPDRPDTDALQNSLVPDAVARTHASQRSRVSAHAESGDAPRPLPRDRRSHACWSPISTRAFARCRTGPLSPVGRYSPGPIVPGCRAAHRENSGIGLPVAATGSTCPPSLIWSAKEYRLHA